jgi:hypothetical protein
LKRGPYRHLAVAGLDVERRVLRQGAQEVLEFSRCHRHGLLVASRQFGMRGDLHLEIGRRDEQLFVAMFKQDVGENWQRMASLDDPRYRL